MKQQIQQLVLQALQQIASDGVISKESITQPVIERARDAQHGDFACNIAMVLAKAARTNPRELAAKVVEALPESELVAKVEIAGPGFINFYLSSNAYHAVVPQVLDTGHAFGHSKLGKGKRIQVEFVSANPTGPLHVGHGRGAAYGTVVADLFQAIGFDVQREYYVNDAGRQMDILTASLWLRYMELCGAEFTFPANGYKGDYVLDIAASLHRVHGDGYNYPVEEVFAGIPADEPDGGDKEAHIDGLIERAKQLLGDVRYQQLFELGLNAILSDISEDLRMFGVKYDNWFHESSLTESGAVERALQRLDDAGHLYNKDGALWFRSTEFGDEKDRVVTRDNGQTTYFASDIAYHMNKLERGFERVIDVWGADHHGYVPRVKAAMEAVGDDPAALDVLLVQFANLYRGGEKLPMSTRSGQFVTLRQLRKEVGTDAARFFYVMRKCEQHMDFDLDLAKSQSNDNPVYYVQYAHARICSVLAQAEEQGIDVAPTAGIINLELLVEEHESALLQTIARFPEVVECAALNKEPHQLSHYVRELANDFHTYYNAHQFLVEDEALRDARIKLILAVRQVVRNGLKLLGVSAPEKM
jgi:arginyl-tRNA synthetase